MNLLDIARSAIPSQPAQGGASPRWRVQFPNLDPVEVLFTPLATHAEVAALYPGAALERLPEPKPQVATRGEATELRSLIQTIGKAKGWPEDEIELGIEVSLHDAENALRCWRSIAIELGIEPQSQDDRRRCSECANLTRQGQCLAAQRGELLKGRNYVPDAELPRRCERYAPGPDDPDRRSGRERWPFLLPSPEERDRKRQAITETNG